MKGQSSKNIQEEHSVAKVELYSKYLAIYLSILSNVPYIKKITIYDLLCGEGEYTDGRKGSSIKAVEVIRDHFLSNLRSQLQISLVLNDCGGSDIEKGIKKIDRVKRISQNIQVPSNVSVEYHSETYKGILPIVFNRLNILNHSQKALILIDPWGYKDINPNELRTLLSNGHSELLLFLPMSFMYRFTEKAYYESFPGGEALNKLLNELFPEGLPNCNSINKFIEAVKLKLKLITQVNYIDTFTLEHTPQNIYCLFFFTKNKLGYKKMLETKWAIDTQQGRGFRLEKTPGLFAQVEVTDYPNKILNFLKQDKTVSNIDLEDFGLNNGFLPRHTNEVLQTIKHILEVDSLDSKPVKGFYIGNDKRLVNIKLKRNG